MNTRDTSPREPLSPKDAARAAREKRLAEALRLNLKRRKGAHRVRPSEEASKAAEGAPEDLPDAGTVSERRGK